MEVESPDGLGHRFRWHQRGDRGSILGVVHGGYNARRLVDEPRHEIGVEGKSHAIDGDDIIKFNAVADSGNVTIDGDAALCEENICLAT